MSLSKIERVEFDELKKRVERLEQWLIKRWAAPHDVHVEVMKKRGRPKKQQITSV